MKETLKLITRKDQKTRLGSRGRFILLPPIKWEKASKLYENAGKLN